MKKMLQATMLAAVCALTTAGATSAPLLDVERTETNVIVAVTPTTDSPIALREVETAAVIETPATPTTIASEAAPATAIDVTPPTSTSTLGPDNIVPVATTASLGETLNPEVRP